MPPDNPTPPRVTSVDALRGFVMLLMLAECLELPKVAKAFPDSPGWQAVRFHTSHVGWEGCSLHDLIQPTFSFLGGAALVFSLAKRRGCGEPFGRSLLHAVLRGAFLVAWGIVLRTFGDNRHRTYFTFEDTLSQIGLGYVPLFLIAHLRPRGWWIALGVILGWYWAAFALYGWAEGAFQFAWAKEDNFAIAFDRWFLQLFPRERPFADNSGGYCTLSFIPTLGTMVLGLMAGDWLRSRDRWGAAFILAGAGLCGIGAGVLLAELGVCPVVKRIWTPAWVLFSGGWCFLLLALLHTLSDAIGYGGWTYPLRVIGANSILIYTLADSPLPRFVQDQLKKHLPVGTFEVYGAAWVPVLKGGAWLAIAWLGLWWLYRRRVFVRV